MAVRIDRRRFLKTAAAAGVVTIFGSASSSLSWPLSAWALPDEGADSVIVSVFLRGAADGLNIICPHGDDDYYRQRGSYAVANGELRDLDGFFGISNHFEPLRPLYNEGHLAVVHAVGSPLPTRSHFEAQPNMESGLGAGGWLQRAIGASAFAGSDAGLSIGDRTSPQLAGPWAGTTVKTVDQAVVSGMGVAVIRPAIEALYHGNQVDALEQRAVLGAFATLDEIADVSPTTGDYPNSAEARSFHEAATLIGADIGVRAIAIDSGGWDHHSDGRDRMAERGSVLSGALRAFFDDLGSMRSRVIVLVSTEFGRTVRPNGSGGTDHGHGNMMLVMGERLHGVGGGKVLVPGGWPGLANNQLYEGRDLGMTTDFRSVYAEVLDRHLGVSDSGAVFPGFAPEPIGLLPSRAAGDVDSSGSVTNADVQALLRENVHGQQAPAGDIDGDGDVDLLDALLLAQQLDN